MDFELSESQEMFRSTLRDFVQRSVKPQVHHLEQNGIYPSDLVSEMAAMGLFGLCIPSAYEGLELDSISMALVFEEISRAWMGLAGILGTHTIACAMIAKFGTESQREKFLPALARGERRTAMALSEPDAGSDLQAITTRATRTESGYHVDGTKLWITNARHANPLPVLVKTDPQATPRHRGMSILLIETPRTGLEVTKDLPKLGYRGPETCEVVLSGVEVPADALLGGQEGQGLQQALWALQLGRINIAARGVGLSQGALEAALAYAHHREAFGEKIVQFQLIQEKIADMATEIQAARLMTYWAASQHDKLGRADTETGMAKLFASEVALRSALEAMRVHGGYGYSQEFDVERLYRDAPLLAIGEGTNEILRTVIARNISREFRS